jgi:hypothetical protein
VEVVRVSLSGPNAGFGGFAKVLDVLRGAFAPEKAQNCASCSTACIFCRSRQKGALGTLVLKDLSLGSVFACDPITHSDFEALMHVRSLLLSIPLCLLCHCGDDDSGEDTGPQVDGSMQDVASEDITVADGGGEDSGGEDSGGVDSGRDAGSSGRQNIRDFVFAERSGDCAEHARSSTAAVLDIQNTRDFDGFVDLEVGESACTLSSNAIPNHDFNDESANFRASDVMELETTWNIPRNPVAADTSTAISLSSYDGVMLNGVVLDLLAAGCFGVGSGMIGCGILTTPYRYDPMSPLASFGTDEHNAHTQPDGRYHYHGDPLALYGEATAVSGVIGFAADGYPIYGPYFDDGTMIRAATSGYVLLDGERAGGPGGLYDGTFVDDYTFEGSGDLDECNGMVVEGQYGYYVTDTYPWVLACFRGTPDASFNKRRP